MEIDWIAPFTEWRAISSCSSNAGRKDSIGQSLNDQRTKRRCENLTALQKLACLLPPIACTHSIQTNISCGLFFYFLIFFWKKKTGLTFVLLSPPSRARDFSRNLHRRFISKTRAPKKMLWIPVIILTDIPRTAPKPLLTRKFRFCEFITPAGGCS